MTETTGTRTATIGTLMANRREIGDAYDEASQQLKDLKASRDLLDLRILELLEEQGVSKTAIPGIGSATATTSEVIQVIDWDAMYAYINETKQPYLLQRRIVGSSISEILAANEDVPGIEVIEKTALSFRRN
jgi:hypothetical protein